MDVLLIYPHVSTSSIEEGVKTPPLGLAYIAAVLEKQGYDIGVLDMNAHPEIAAHFRDFLEEKRPRIVGITCLTPFYSTVLSLARKVKEFIGVKVIVGGAHATALPEDMLAENAIDYVVLGEGESTMTELVDCLLNGGGSPEDIAGIAYIRGTEYYRTEARPYTPNLDEIPFPARHLLTNGKYSSPQFGASKVTSIITSRGCPYNCIYCDYRYLMGLKFRRRSPHNVIAEIEECVEKYDVRYFSFRDSTFTFDEKWISDFCQLIKGKGIRINWDCNGRVSLVTDSMLREMKEAGCLLISYGVESGDQEILDFANKKTTVEQVRSAFKMTKKAGIETVGYFMIGLPGENWRTIQKTLKLASELNCKYAQFSLAIPFPGTPLYDYAKEHNLIRNVSWDDFSPMNKAILRTQELDFVELEKALKVMYKRYYLRPKYILNRAIHVRPSNLKSNWQGVKMFVGEIR